MIRKQSKPDKPYYTMELSPRGVIVQVRGDHNCGMTKDVEVFVEAYKEYLRKLTKKRGAKAVWMICRRLARRRWWRQKSI